MGQLIRTGFSAAGGSAPDGDLGPGPGWVWAGQEVHDHDAAVRTQFAPHVNNGTADYAWGAQGLFIYKTLTGDVLADNSQFGDANPNSFKNLWVRPKVVVALPTATKTATATATTKSKYTTPLLLLAGAAAFFWWKKKKE
jgi:hypothetical protein